MAGDDPLLLPRITVLLPTRRAVRSLRDAFLRVAPDGKVARDPVAAAADAARSAISIPTSCRVRRGAEDLDGAAARSPSCAGVAADPARPAMGRAARRGAAAARTGRRTRGEPRPASRQGRDRGGKFR